VAARFSYYAKLTRREQAIYDKSDSITEVELALPEPLRPLAEDIETTLAVGKRGPIRDACQSLADELANDLSVSRVAVRVLAVRPSNPNSELHGLYEATDGGAPAKIDLWMRTAARRKVVAYRTFLRTLLHEFCHHLDYELFGLPDSFHTQGFFQRESSLFRQLVE
jgi:hypothetical protein